MFSRKCQCNTLVTVWAKLECPKKSQKCTTKTARHGSLLLLGDISWKHLKTIWLPNLFSLLPILVHLPTPAPGSRCHLLASACRKVFSERRQEWNSPKSIRAQRWSSASRMEPDQISTGWMQKLPSLYLIVTWSTRKPWAKWWTIDGTAWYPYTSGAELFWEFFFFSGFFFFLVGGGFGALSRLLFGKGRFVRVFQDIWGWF